MKVIHDVVYNPTALPIHVALAGRNFCFEPYQTAEFKYSDDLREQEWATRKISQDLAHLGLRVLDLDALEQAAAADDPAERKANIERLLREIQMGGLNQFRDNLTQQYEIHPGNDNINLMKANKEARPPDPLNSRMLKIRDTVDEVLRKQGTLSEEAQLRRITTGIKDMPNIDLAKLPIEDLKAMAKARGLKLPPRGGTKAAVLEILRQPMPTPAEIGMAPKVEGDPAD